MFMFDLNIHDCTPRYAIDGMRPWSYAIIFSDWQGMLWWDNGDIQNAFYPSISEAPKTGEPDAQ